MRTAAAGEKDLGVRAQREGSRIVEGGGWTDNSPRRSTHGAYVIQKTMSTHTCIREGKLRAGVDVDLGLDYSYCHHLLMHIDHWPEVSVDLGLSDWITVHFTVHARITLQSTISEPRASRGLRPPHHHITQRTARRSLRTSPHPQLPRPPPLRFGAHR